MQQLPASAGAAGAADSTRASADPVSSPATDSGSPLDAPLPAPSEFTANCCARPFSRLETILGAIANTLPQLIGQNRNTNLLLAAARMFADLPGQFRSVKTGLATFRTATDQAAAIAALAQVTSAIEALKVQTSAALQTELPPVDLGGTAQSFDASAPAEPPGAAPSQLQAEADTAANEDKQKAVDTAKKGLGKLIKKKVKIP